MFYLFMQRLNYDDLLLREGLSPNDYHIEGQRIINNNTNEMVGMISKKEVYQKIIV